MTLPVSAGVSTPVSRLFQRVLHHLFHACFSPGYSYSEPCNGR
jgi:hypothetical protein